MSRYPAGRRDTPAKVSDRSVLARRLVMTGGPRAADLRCRQISWSVAPTKQDWHITGPPALMVVELARFVTFLRML